MKIGIVFEDAFNEALRHEGCMAVTCDVWDHHQKTDSIVMRIDGRRIRHPVEVQVTLQRDSLLKLAAYLAYIDGRPKGGEMRRSLYVEVAAGVTPAYAASEVKKCILLLETDRRSGGPYGLRVGKEGGEWFDPRRKQAELAELASPERTAHLRIGGAIVDVQPHGILMVTMERGPYWAYDGDIADKRLRGIIRGHRNGRRSAFGVGVSFIANGVSNPHGRAKSVICAPARHAASCAAA